MFGKMMPRGVKKLPISNMNMFGMGPKMIKSIMKKKNVDSLQVMMQSADGPWCENYCMCHEYGYHGD